jgi:hypothetical protein
MWIHSKPLQVILSLVLAAAFGSRLPECERASNRLSSLASISIGARWWPAKPSLPLISRSFFRIYKAAVMHTTRQRHEVSFWPE